MNETSDGNRAPASGATQGLRARMLRAAGWLAGASATAQLLRLASNLVLTRLLVPEAFGLVAAVSTFYVALVMVSDLGIWQSVVRSHRADDPRFLGTAFTLQCLRGLLLALGVLGLALALRLAADAGGFAPGTVYADPRLPAMTAVFALCALLQGAESIRLATAQRELRTGQLARLEITSQIVGTVFTVALAWGTRSVWALPAGAVVAAAARTLLSHRLPGPPAPPCWDREAARELVGFGKWIVVSSLVGFLASQGEKLLLGATLNITGFGVFSIASALLGAATAVYATVNGHLIFPGLSLAMREGAEATRRVYGRVQQATDLLLGTLAGAAMTAGHWAVWLLYDDRYAAAGWMLQWLAPGLLAMRMQVVEQLMFARGRPGLVVTNNAVRAALLALLVPAGYSVAGEQGAVAAVALAQFAGWPLSMAFRRVAGLPGWRAERWWLPALCAGMAAGWALDALLEFALGAPGAR